jgi:hypothetical protein
VPGWTVDRFGEVLVSQITASGLEAFRDEAYAALAAAFPRRPHPAVERLGDAAGQGARLAGGRTVLDLFAYTGAFALYALRGGAGPGGLRGVRGPADRDRTRARRAQRPPRRAPGLDEARGDGSEPSGNLTPPAPWICPLHTKLRSEGGPPTHITTRRPHEETPEETRAPS